MRQKSGISLVDEWIPAFAGMTRKRAGMTALGAREITKSRFLPLAFCESQQKAGIHPDVRVNA